MNYIANKKIRTNGTRQNPKAQSYEPEDLITADAYDAKTFEAWLKKGIVRKEGEEAPAPLDEEDAAPAAQHESEDVVPGKSRQTTKSKKS